MTMPDGPDDSRRVEEDLRRQLRWIEDDVMITLRGRDPQADRADATLHRLSAALPPASAPSGWTRATARVRRWWSALRRRVAGDV